jgi:hypothetical protein
MKRRHWLASLLGLGGLTTAAAERKIDTPARRDYMLPFRDFTPKPVGGDKTDLGIPHHIKAGETRDTEFMQVYIDRGRGEELWEQDMVLEVDVDAGMALVWETVPVERPKGANHKSDIFGYRLGGRRLDTDGPRVVYGDFRIRWQNKPHVVPVG